METQVPEEKIIAQADYICKKRPRHNHGVRGEYSSLRTLTLPFEIRAPQLLQMMYLVLGIMAKSHVCETKFITGFFDAVFRLSFRFTPDTTVDLVTFPFLKSIPAEER